MMGAPNMANFGMAPYEEAAARGQARVSLMQRLGQIFSGAGYGLAATPQNAGGLESLATGFAGGYGQANAARQAAEAYAMKKIQAERANEERQARQGLIEAQTAKASRPEPAPKEPAKREPFQPQPWWMAPGVDPKVRDQFLHKQTHVSTGKGAAPPKIKPISIPRRIPAKLTEQQIIDSINQETDPSVLTPYIVGHGGADSADIRRAAQLRANGIQAQGR